MTTVDCHGPSKDDNCQAAVQTKSFRIQHPNPKSSALKLNSKGPQTVALCFRAQERYMPRMSLRFITWLRYGRCFPSKARLVLCALLFSPSTLNPNPKP